MAFDFVSYITQQIEQDYSNFFVNDTKEKKHAFAVHLVALQLLQLSELSQQSPKQVYDIILDKNVAWLIEKTKSTVFNNDNAKHFFSADRTEFSSLNEKVTHILLDELSQLNENANLGVFGVQELLVGQYAWLQTHVDSWFWDTVGKPEYKSSAPIKDEKAEFSQVMKEFSQMIQEQAHAHQQTETLSDAPVEVSKLYLILNPMIALVVIYALFAYIL